MLESGGNHLIGTLPIVPKQARAQEKRNALLRSGRILFVEKGYESTTAKEIAAHAGVATGTFYRYFSDKRQLLMSLIEDKLESFITPIPNWENLDREAFLAITLREHFEKLNELGLHRVLPELIHHDRELAEVIFEVKRKIYLQILIGLEQAKEKGCTWQDLNLELVAWSIISIIEKIPEMNTGNGKEPNYEEIAKVICRLVFPPK